MKKLALLSLVFCLACTEKNIQNPTKIDIAKDYIKAQNESDYKASIALFKDSIRMKEIVYDMSYSKDAYLNLFQWDSTFNPTYKILEIEESPEGEVLMTVSKSCPRILFLNEEPIVTKEKMTFDGNKIQRITITEYKVFNEETWANKRAELVSFVEESHPELNGFLYDQTKAGAIKYLKALELFKEEN